MKHDYTARGNRMGKIPLAQYIYDYCVDHEITAVAAIMSHEALSEIGRSWYTIDDRVQGGELQSKLMNAIQTTKIGRELFIWDGEEIDLKGVLRKRYVRVYRLKGYENEEIVFQVY